MIGAVTVVMAHPSRKYWLIEMMNMILIGGYSLDEGAGENANGDSAWRCGWDIAMEHGDIDWVVVLQDDALPVPGYDVAIREALEHVPYRTAVSFYTGGGRPHTEKVQATVDAATRNGCSWWEAVTLLWGVGVAMPVEAIPDFLLWADKHPDLPYDRRIGRYFRSQGKKILYTNPSLVDHRDGVTLVNHPHGYPTMQRKAISVGIPDTWVTDVQPFCN